MSDFVGSVALIRKMNEERTSWLLRKGDSDDRFILADRLDGESYRTALQREVAWQLRLDQKKDFIISSVPRLHYQSPMQTPQNPQDTPSTKACSISPEAGIYWMIVQFFVIDLYGKRSRGVIEANHGFQWWTTHEILVGEHSSGAKLDMLQRELIRLTGVISPVDG